MAPEPNLQENATLSPADEGAPEVGEGDAESVKRVLDYENEKSKKARAEQRAANARLENMIANLTKTVADFAKTPATPVDPQSAESAGVSDESSGSNSAPGVKSSQSVLNSKNGGKGAKNNKRVVRPAILCGRITTPLCEEKKNEFCPLFILDLRNATSLNFIFIIVITTQNS